MGKCYLNESFWPIPFGLRNKLYYLQLFVLNVQCLRHVPGSNWHCYCNNCPICLKTLVYDIIFYKPITMDMALTSPVRWRNIDIMVEVLTIFGKTYQIYLNWRGVLRTETFLSAVQKWYGQKYQRRWQKKLELKSFLRHLDVRHVIYFINFFFVTYDSLSC